LKEDRPILSAAKM